MNIYNRDVAIGVLGSACNNLNLLRDRNYEINQNDFDDMLHKLIFSVLQNLALEKDISEVDGFIVANYLANHPVQYERFKAGNGVELIGRFKEFANSCSFDYCYKMMKKYSLLRRYDSVGMDVREIFNPEMQRESPALRQLRLLIEDCSEDEAAAIIPVFRSVLTAMRDQNATLIK